LLFWGSAHPQYERVGSCGNRHSRSGVASEMGWRALLSAWRLNWSARRRLLRCYALDPRFARDIGLTETDIEVERHSPFWKALRPRD
jgi:uncharacterized protein YjiS (DUF1127 family)